MAPPTKIQHPLLQRPGSSQSKRNANGAALQEDYNLIDSRSLGDLLDYIHQYARQVVFPELKTDKAGVAYAELSNWLDFFEKSLPFRLAHFGKQDFDHLEEGFAKILETIMEDPSAHNLELLVDFCFYELVSPIARLDTIVDEYEFDLKPYLKGAIRTSLASPLRRYTQLSNTSGAYFGVGRHRFSDLTKDPWNITIEDTFAVDSSITKVSGGPAGAVLWLKEELAATAREMLLTMRKIGQELPNHIAASLEAIQSGHEPHLGLLFTFLRLLSPFQRDLNKLTQKHLDFFYQQVLKITPKESVQDKAHLVFQIANHLDRYPISQGTVFKDGKDTKNADILFRLDDEIVIDKAEVKELKTLYLNTTDTCIEPVKGKNGDTANGENKGESSRRSVIEGIYIAPEANSADGKGAPFKEDQSENWATLGAKTSKLTSLGKENPDNHPFGRIGFILASPVLWLNEGSRDVTITVTCDAGANADMFSKCFEDNVDAFSKKQFYKVGEQTIIKIENLFSLEAKVFLQDKLERNLPLTNEELADRNLFSEDEAGILDRLLETTDTGDSYVLKEMPFASLVRYFNVLRLQQDPYRIGFDVESFLQSRDPVTCQPLVKESVREDIRKRLDTEPKGVDWFMLQFSGEKGWFEAKTKPDFTRVPASEALTLFSSSSLVTLNIGSSARARSVKLTFRAFLGADEPKVVFYDENVINEHFKLERPFPMVKIELNPEVQLACENHCEQGQCCLLIPGKSGQVMTALYQFFRDLKVQSVDIQVMVCGMKNLIVQNQESLQDVNKPILPFGARPKVGAEFYIGNKELFGKNWQTFWINTEWKDKPDDLKEYYKDYDADIAEDSFRFTSAVLADRKWRERKAELVLFKDDQVENLCGRMLTEDSAYYHEFHRDQFSELPRYEPKALTPDKLEPLSVNSDDDFFRMSLQGKDFQHDRYPFVLAKNMFDLANLLNPVKASELLTSVRRAAALHKEIETKIEDVNRRVQDLRKQIASAEDVTGLSRRFDDVRHALDAIDKALSTAGGPSSDQIKDAIKNARSALDKLNSVVSKLGNDFAKYNSQLSKLTKDINELLNKKNREIERVDEKTVPSEAELKKAGVTQLLGLLGIELGRMEELLKPVDKKALALPNEPYSPTIKSVEMDYYAIGDTDDIDLIHLYPFANSSKTEYLELGPTLLPTFSDEGTLFVGLDNLRPGGNLQLLFQFAEATADSESDRADINWHHLTGNRWQPLRTGFEILSDGTDRLTRSGIVKIAVPRDISNAGNTLMPPTQDGKHLYWIKASAPKSVAAVAELFDVRAQAALTTYQSLPNSDPNRLGEPLEPNKISKPLDPNFNIKKVEQPYESFGGRLAEAEGHLYTRVSEHLQHKGRSVAIFDFERLVLETFPELFKCKCISHTLGLFANDYRRDLEVAPGFITVAVVPDLRKLKPGEVTAPKAPLSLLGKVKEYLQQRTSPFARICVRNPRYEKIHVYVKVRLVRGRDETYYTAQLKTDLTRFLAPWSVGDSDKLAFGQHVIYSDVVGFIENLEYVQFITDLELRDSEGVSRKEIVPLTARSILTAGEICIDLHRENCTEPPTPAPYKTMTASLLSQSVSFTCGESRPFLGSGKKKGIKPVDAP